MYTVEGENELLLTCRKYRTALPSCAARRATTACACRTRSAAPVVLARELRAQRTRAGPAWAGRFSRPRDLRRAGAEARRKRRPFRSLPQPPLKRGQLCVFQLRRLKTLTLSSAVTDFGGGALMNCRALREVRLCRPPPPPPACTSCSASTRVSWMCVFLERDSVLPALPRLFRGLEALTPAHIFQRRIHGAGYGYRQCFDGGALSTHQYDRALSACSNGFDFLCRSPRHRIGGWQRRSACRTPPPAPPVWTACRPRGTRSPAAARARRSAAHLPAVARCAVSS